MCHIRLSYVPYYQVVGPELVSAVITLSNIESEIAFFHACLICAIFSGGRMSCIRLSYISTALYSTVLYVPYNQVVGPELVSAVITLSNIESEIAFFHIWP